MEKNTITVKLGLDGEGIEKQAFLDSVRSVIHDVTGEKMTLDIIINEIAKNIFDHAGGKGALTLTYDEESVAFHIRDFGEKTYDFGMYNIHPSFEDEVDSCVGLRTIETCSLYLGIDLQIDTTRGFSYSGTYKKRTH